ncbi:alpha/beta fold hydrolase [Nocardia sp. NPDC101769]|uniref:alpha/beta fold hydrolase n=1 Tax=Nocardia sp. NPDC101769 TaxID=3364333 RepID=UPI003828817A
MNFVLIPGGWFGGWWYSDLASELRRHGHTAYPVTLTGVGDRSHLLSPTTNLDTHIHDVVSVLEFERLDNVILVGHSYAGMVITGVADRIPERVAALVYSDAYVPADGQSCFELTSPLFQRIFLDGAAGDGITVPVPAGADPRATGHPLASFLQRIRLTREAPADILREYIYLSEWEGTPFTAVYEQLQHDPSWRTHSLPTSHNVLADAPDEYLKLLLDIADRATSPRS